MAAANLNNSGSQATYPGGNLQDWGVKLLLALLVVILAILQYQLWLSPTGLRGTDQLRSQIADQRQKNQDQQSVNNQLRAEVNSLKSGLQQVEARARSELGMVKSDETFFLIIDEPEKGDATKKGGDD